MNGNMHYKPNRETSALDIAAGAIYSNQGKNPLIRKFETNGSEIRAYLVRCKNSEAVAKTDKQQDELPASTHEQREVKRLLGIIETKLVQEKGERRGKAEYKKVLLMVSKLKEMKGTDGKRKLSDEYIAFKLEEYQGI
ncbi:MAG: hypothetical protein NTV88_06300 [Candidatus Micrarchaeota archaeon]|nr:hypothetical protein [Candidatus Micrarchaeota archaeon]